MAKNDDGNIAKTQGLYDRIADVHNLAMRINGYQRSVAKYLSSLDLDIDENSLVLDAGSGTGMVTLGLHDSGLKPARIIDLDLSYKSLEVARDEVSRKQPLGANITNYVQANVLRMPFPDDTF